MFAGFRCGLTFRRCSTTFEFGRFFVDDCQSSILLIVDARSHLMFSRFPATFDLCIRCIFWICLQMFIGMWRSVLFRRSPAGRTAPARQEGGQHNAEGGGKMFPIWARVPSQKQRPAGCLQRTRGHQARAEDPTPR